MDHEQAAKFLASSMRFGSRLGLERMERLMELLGHPAQGIPCIHVAGTNGKGSVCTMIANIHAAQGFRTGLYTSPFIHRFSERIRIIDGGKGLGRLTEDESEGEISNKEIAQTITKVKAAVDIMLKEGMEHPTEFELVTAAGFLHFENMHCDMVVLETGLGGRLDSTNVIQRPLKCIITAIGYDHMDRLGETISQIAAEKAGIIKKGSTVICLDPKDYAEEDDAGIIKDVLEETARRKEAASISFVGKDNISLLESTPFCQRFKIELNGISFITETMLPGEHQLLNCALAAAACADKMSTESIVKGISVSRWPGRLEALSKERPVFILDGAHNMQAVLELKKYLKKYFSGSKIIFVCGFMRDKDHGGMLRKMLDPSSLDVHSIYCVTPDNPRALPAKELADGIRDILDNSTAYGYNDLVKVIPSESVREGARMAFIDAIENDSAVIAFGSLYMAGDIRSEIKKLRS